MMRFNRRILAGLAVVGLVGAAIVVAAGSPAIRKGSKVAFNYTLKVDGNVVDTSAGREPLSYVQGSGQIIPGLEEEMVGLKKGAKKHVSVSPAKGYGIARSEAIQTIPRKDLKHIKDLKVGTIVTGQDPTGHPVRARVVALDRKNVTLDFNHPLAGKSLEFDIEIVDVKNGG